MPADSDLLFGKIAIVQGFCSKAKVDHCVKRQARSNRPMPLGRHLVDEGVITEEQHSKVLEIQRRNLRARDPVQKTSRETVLFGRLAVREGYLSEVQVNECLRLQGLDDETRPLGEIAVALGHLTSDQVKALLSRQLKKIMSCPECRLSYTVLSISTEPKLECPRCKGLLQEGKPGESTRVDAELDTQAVKSLKSEGEDVSGETPPGAARRINVTCKICSHRFEGVVDSTSRVRCPSCLTRYVVRQTPS